VSHQVGATGSEKLHLWKGRWSQHAGRLRRETGRTLYVCYYTKPMSSHSVGHPAISGLLSCQGRSSSIPPLGDLRGNVAPYWLPAVMYVGRCSTLTETSTHSVRNFIILRTIAARRTDICQNLTGVTPVMLAHMKLASKFNHQRRPRIPTIGTLRLWCCLQHAARTAAFTALVFWEHF
jgi:hypothetical protein